MGDNLKILRLTKDLTQKQFAKILSTDRRAISVYERNKEIPSKMVLKRICNKFDVLLEDLIPGIKDLPENTIGEKLKKIRLCRGYSIAELCKLIKINHRTLQRLEANETKLSDEKLIYISNVLDLPCGYLENKFQIPPDLDKNTMTVGELIEKIRKHNFMSVYKLSKMSNVSDTTIEYYESNKSKKPNKECLKRIAQAFNLPENYFEQISKNV